MLTKVMNLVVKCYQYFIWSMHILQYISTSFPYGNVLCNISHYICEFLPIYCCSVSVMFADVGLMPGRSVAVCRGLTPAKPQPTDPDLSGAPGTETRS